MRALDRRRLIYVVVVSGMVLAACTGGSSTGGGPTSAPSGDPGTAVGPTAAPSAAPSVAPSSVPAPTPSPSATPTPPPAGGGTGTPTTAPPKPSHTTYVLVKETVSSDQITITERYRATSTEPAGVATGFRVYGVTDCVRYSKKYDDTPCVVPGMQIPLSKLERWRRTEILERAK